MIGNHGWHFEQVFSSKSMKLFIYLSTIKCSIQIQHYQLTTKEYTYVYDRWPCSDCFAPCFQPNYPAMELAMDSALEIAEDPATTWRSVRFLIGLNGFYSKKSTFLLASELGSFVNFPLETKYQTTKKCTVYFKNTWIPGPGRIDWTFAEVASSQHLGGWWVSNFGTTMNLISYNCNLLLFHNLIEEYRHSWRGWWWKTGQLEDNME